MKQRMNTFLGIALVAAVLICGSAWAQTETGPTPPPPDMKSALCTDGTYLYVGMGRFVFQYDMTDSSLINTLELEELEPVETRDDATGESEPPLRAPMVSGISTDGARLYVLVGPLVHQYSLPDLEFLEYFQIPKPEAGDSAQSTGTHFFSMR